MTEKIDVAKVERIAVPDLYQILSIKKLRWWYTSKSVVIIRPKFPNDPYTEWFSYPAAELIKNKAIAEGWKVTDLKINDSNRAKVMQTLTNTIQDFVVHYDHGSEFVMWGQNNNQSEAAIDNNNVSLLQDRAISTVSCLTAVGLGPLAITAGAKAYLGYDDLHWVYFAWTQEFTEAANAANNALLEGKTYQDAFNIAYTVYTQKFLQILNAGDFPAAAAMLNNRDRLTLLGNPNAKATSTRSLLAVVPLTP